MPPPNNHKIAILTGLSSEFFRWKTATQAVDELIHRVIDGEMFEGATSPRFISLLCLPLWRQGYTDADAMLLRVSAALIGPSRVTAESDGVRLVSAPHPAGTLETLTVAQADATGALRAILDDAAANAIHAITNTAPLAVDRRTQVEVLQAWDVSTDVRLYLPGDCLTSLVTMMRIADGRDLRPAEHTNFVGFYLQLLAHRYASLNRTDVAQSPVRMPRVPDTYPPELLEQIPDRLMREELRVYSNDADWARQVSHTNGVRLMMDIYRLRQLENERTTDPVIIRQERERLAESIHVIRQALAAAAPWHSEPGQGLPRIPQPMPEMITREEVERLRPPPTRPARRATVSYVPGSLINRTMERMAAEERSDNEVRRRESATPRRPRIRDDG